MSDMPPGKSVGSIDSVCCSCGYAGNVETPCPTMEDEQHCAHWWNGTVVRTGAHYHAPCDTVSTLEQRVRDLEANLFAATATVASLEDKLATVERERDQARAVYDALLFSVHRKFPGETRHQTALRYIRQAEQLATDGQTKQALGEG